MTRCVSFLLQFSCDSHFAQVLFYDTSFLRINLTMRDTLTSDPSASEAEGLDERMLNVGHALDQPSCDKAASTTLSPADLPVPTASTVLRLTPVVASILGALLERAQSFLPAKRSLETDTPNVPKQTRRKKSIKDPLEVAEAEASKAAATAITTAAVAAKAAEREVIKAAAAIARAKKNATNKAAAEEAKAARTAIAEARLARIAMERQARIAKEKTASTKKAADVKSAAVAASTTTLPPRRIQSTAAKTAALIAAHKAELADAAARDEQADAAAIAAFDAAVVYAAAAVERGSAVASPTTETAKVERARVLEALADL
jgi:hypothetical protein